jgi:hypothetical protein
MCPSSIRGAILEGAMPETAKVFEDREHPGEWRVEWFDDDGGCEVEIFTGPHTRDQAIRYADHQYGKFEEVSIIRGLTIA